MRPDRYTLKSQEALERAQRLARDRSHQRLEATHLLAALLQEPEGTVAAVLEKLGVPREPLLARAEAALDRLPRVQGGAMYPGEGLRRVLEGAERAAERMQDDYVSVEHLLLALVAPEPDSSGGALSADDLAASRRLERSGVTAEALLQALRRGQIRQGAVRLAIGRDLLQRLQHAVLRVQQRGLFICTTCCEESG